jgi:hypothetical protein
MVIFASLPTLPWLHTSDENPKPIYIGYKNFIAVSNNISTLWFRNYEYTQHILHKKFTNNITCALKLNKASPDK